MLHRISIYPLHHINQKVNTRFAHSIQTILRLRSLTRPFFTSSSKWILCTFRFRFYSKSTMHTRCCMLPPAHLLFLFFVHLLLFFTACIHTNTSPALSGRLLATLFHHHFHILWILVSCFVYSSCTSALLLVVRCCCCCCCLFLFF